MKKEAFQIYLAVFQVYLAVATVNNTKYKCNMKFVQRILKECSRSMISVTSFCYRRSRKKNMPYHTCYHHEVRGVSGIFHGGYRK